MSITTSILSAHGSRCDPLTVRVPLGIPTQSTKEAEA